MRDVLKDLWRSGWRTVALFAYRQWITPGYPLPIGVPGNRDPDHPCTGYEPRTRTRRDFARCNSDGHYLCHGCANFIDDEVA